MPRLLMLTLPALLAAMLAAGCARPDMRFEFTRLVMGVKARVVLYAPDADAAASHAQAVYDRLNALDAILSDYRVDSELARFLKGSPGEPQAISSDFAFLLARAQTLRDLSGGAFDIEAAACVKLWRHARTSGLLPNPVALEGARPLPGQPGYALEPDMGAARLLRPGIEIDFGGIGKGYAAQQAVDLLRGRGINRCLIALAGDIVAADPPPGSPGWNIAISRSSTEPPFATIQLANRAVSTSGDAEQIVEISGLRYTHIVDPRTGQALRTPVCVSVLAERGEDADAWASALCVLATREEPTPSLEGDPLQHAAWIIDLGGDAPSRTVHGERSWAQARLRWISPSAPERP